MFAFVGEAERSEEMNERNTEANLHTRDHITEENTNGEEAAVTKMETPRVMRLTIGTTMHWKIIPGEHVGWWLSRKFGRRVRMRAL